MDPALSERPALRLVRMDVDSAKRRRADATRSEGPGLAATDPRWVFAVRVSTQLEGGSAAILTPDRRRRLMRTAEALGLRAFDASVLIAIVQDGARRGEAALSADVARRIEAAPAPTKPRADAVGAALSMISAALIAVALVALSVRWLLGG